MSGELDLASYNKQIDERYAHIKDILNDKGWNKEKEDKGATFYKRTEQGSGFQQVKSVVTISKPIDEVVNAVKNTKPIDSNTPKDEREGFIERRRLKSVEGDPNDACFVYIIVESPSKLVTSRDFLMYCKVFKEDNGMVSIVRTSIVNDGLMPNNKKYVRGNMIFQAYVCEPIENGKTKLTFVVHADPAGSVPAMIYNTAVIKQGYSAVKIKDALEG